MMASIQSGAAPAIRRAGRGLRAASRPMRSSTRLCASGPDIRLIVTDVDGTLLNSQQQLADRTLQAVRAAAAVGVPLVVATGKARGPWVGDVLPHIAPMPGVFLQGLLICDARGGTLYSRCLDADVALDCMGMASDLNLTLTVYSDARIFCAAVDEHTDRLLFYREPTPEPVGDLQGLVGAHGMQKMIFMAPQERLDAVRPGIEAALAGRASLTTALSGMLEVLPLGASKGAGVEWLLHHMGVDPAHCLAMGDGENDVEMLGLAGVGVAMGNAGPRVKAAADAVVSTNDAGGVAEAIERFVLQPRGAMAK